MSTTECNPGVRRTDAYRGHCTECDPVWKAIQAEAQDAAEREPFLSDELEKLVISQPGLVAAIAAVLENRLFGRSDGRFAEIVRDAVARDPRIRDAIRADLYAVRRHDPATTSYLNPFLHFKGFLALQAYRIAHWLWQNDRLLLARHLQGRISEVFGIDIHPAASIGSGVFIDHGTGVVIGETSVIGDEVVILHGVTLGGTGKETGDRHPKIGHGVLLGAGALLLGNITIGDGARIGAGSVVVRSVPAGDTVVGVAAQVKARSDIAVLREAS